MAPGNRRATATASIGIAFGSNGESSDDLLRNADLAMYVAKDGGRNRFNIYAPEMHDAVVQQLEVDSQLRGAASRGELVVAYQPVVDPNTGAMRALEALVRWHHPDYGLLMPDDFIPVAERSDLIEELGEHVLMESCEMAKAWEDQLPTGSAPSITVNMSPRQVIDKDLPNRVADQLATCDLPPHRLILEITETALMQDATATAAVMTAEILPMNPAAQLQ